MHLNRFKTGAIAAASLLMVMAGVVCAGAAIEGIPRTGAPSWLSLFGVAIEPDRGAARRVRIVAPVERSNRRSFDFAALRSG